jgi:hypothetical protein
MKRTLTVGDLHGKSCWREAIKHINDFDYIIFIGDYMDSFTISPDDQVENLANLLYVQKQHPGKIKLLWGNHDLPYYYYGTDMHGETRCPGFKDYIAWKVKQLMLENIEAFTPAFQIGNTIWTHAGISQWVWDNWVWPKYELFHDKNLWPEHNVAWFLNKLFTQKDGSIYQVGVARYGWQPRGHIFWADKSELRSDPLMGYDQVVGHSFVPDITETTNEFGNYTTFTDCLDTKIAFYDKNIEEDS